MPESTDPYEALMEFAEAVEVDLEGEITAKNHDPRNIEHSICDIIDNSIDGGASEIEITIASQDTYLSEAGEVAENDFLYLKDNGNGIESDDLRKIITFYNKREYDWWELGNFGIGLKDSLLAHGKEITVISKAEGCNDYAWVKLSTTMARKDGTKWVLVHSDKVGENLPDELKTLAFNTAISEIEDMEKGTIVLLEYTHSNLLDARQDDDEEDNSLVGISMEDTLKEWIALTFSDYLRGIDIGPRSRDNPLSIKLNGNPIECLDPFMSDQIGIGEFNGQQGTLVEPYSFTTDEMDFEINRYILPNEVEREQRTPGIDARMVTATRRGHPRLQGIFIKRNGRILDGPWHDQWRFIGHGMGYSHNTNSRWELILPPNSIEDFDLVTPDKREVDLSRMVTELRRANRDKITWHPEDEHVYGRKMTGEATTPNAQYNHRARARNNSNDTIKICNSDGCGRRCIPYSNDFCEDHLVPLCTICQQPKPLNDNGWCDACSQNICESENCESLKAQNSRHCLACSQPNCSAENCSNLQTIDTNYCEEHEASVCMWPECREQRSDDFTVCSNHRSMEIGGRTVELCLNGNSEPLFEIEETLIRINLDSPEFPILKTLLSTGE